MPTTSPDGIFFPDTSSPGDLITNMATQAQSVQDALNRQVQRVADINALAALSTTGLSLGDLAHSAEGGAYFSWSGASWRQITIARFDTQAARDSAYAKASGAYLTSGVARAYCADIDREFTYYTNADNPRVPVSAWCLSDVVVLTRINLGTNPIPTSETDVASSSSSFNLAGPGSIIFSFGGRIQLNSAMSATITLYFQGVAREQLVFQKSEAGIDVHSLSAFWMQSRTDTGQWTATTKLTNIASVPTASILSAGFYEVKFIPAQLMGA